MNAYRENYETKKVPKENFSNFIKVIKIFINKKIWKKLGYFNLYAKGLIKKLLTNKSIF